MNSTPRLGSNADLIAAIPAILGYAVTNDLVILILTGHRSARSLHCALRLDMATTKPGDLAELPHRAGQALAAGNGAILVAITDDPRRRDHVAELIDAATAVLGSTGVDVQRRLIATTTTRRGQWMDLDTLDTGATYPFQDSVIAADQVYRGRPIVTSREAIVAEFDAAEPSHIDTLGPSSTPVTDTLDELAAVIAGQRGLSDDLPAKIAALITASVRLRDAMLAAALTEPARSAVLWTQMAARMRGAARAQALTIAACLYYVSADGVRTGIALDIAVAAATDASAPVPPLTTLLDTALRSGFTPDQVRDVLTAAQSAADRGQ